MANYRSASVQVRTAKGEAFTSGKRDSFAINYGSVLSAQAISTIANFAITVLVSRTYGVEQFGLFIYAFALSELFYFMAEFGLPTALIGEAPHFGYCNEFFSTVFRLQTSFFLGAFFCVLMFETFFEHSPDRRFMIVCVALYLLAQAPSRTLRAVFRSFERTRYEAFTTLLEKGSVVSFCIVATALKLSLQVLVAGLAVLGLANIILLTVVCRRSFVKVGWGKAWGRVRSAVMFAAMPLGLSACFTIINLRIGTVILERAQGSIQVGLFGAAQRLVTPLAYIVLTLQAAVMPVFARRMDSDGSSVRLALNGLLRWALVSGLIIVGVFQLAGSRVVTLVFGHQYIQAGPVLRLLIVSVPLTFGINIAGIALVLMRRYHYLTIACVASCVVTLAGNLVLVGSYGANGVCCAVVLSEATLLFGILRFAREFIGSKEGWRIVACSAASTGITLWAPTFWSLAGILIVIGILVPKNPRFVFMYLQRQDGLTSVSTQPSLVEA
jgi:O-antigen/teichoic acid export membrane protein